MAISKIEWIGLDEHNKLPVDQFQEERPMFMDVKFGAYFKRPQMPTLCDFTYMKIGVETSEGLIHDLGQAINVTTGVVINVLPAERVKLEDAVGEAQRRKAYLERNVISFASLGLGEVFRLRTGRYAMIKCGEYFEYGHRNPRFFGLYLHSGNMTTNLRPDTPVIRVRVKMKVMGDVER